MLHNGRVDLVPIVEWEGGGEKGKWFLEQAKGRGASPKGTRKGEGRHWEGKGGEKSLH